MAGVVLAPGEVAFEETGVDRGHFGGAVVVLHAEIFRAQEAEDGAGGDGGHETALPVEPFGVALFRDAVDRERLRVPLCYLLA